MNSRNDTVLLIMLLINMGRIIKGRAYFAEYIFLC